MISVKMEIYEGEGQEGGRGCNGLKTHLVLSHAVLKIRKLNVAAREQNSSASTFLKMKSKRKIVNLEMLVILNFLHITITKLCFYKRPGYTKSF